HYTPSAEPTTDTETTAKRLTPKISPKKSSHHRFSGRPDELGLSRKRFRRPFQKTGDQSLPYS
ncbi:MAG: hypothetical protein AB7I48_13660, partial [Planctomycetaceae bacterium]